MEKIRYDVLGVMSGTSLDGIDLAFIQFEFRDSWEYQIITADTLAYPAEWQKRLSEAISYNDQQLHELDEQYTQFLAETISGFLTKNNIKELDAICSHGHTIKHEPENGYTLQIGNLPELAQLTGRKVVCNFRVQDVKLGGQGAPLVPIGDELLFPAYQYCLNLGGFANVSTVLNGQRVAYDICPVNTVLNFLAAELHLAYDRNGEIAASGTTDKALLQQLNALEFYFQKPPKSLGIEWVNKHIFPMLNNKDSIPTLLNTYTLHAAIQISEMFDNKPASKVLVTGGGAFNGFLMDQIKKRTKNEIVIPSPKVVNFKEALIFGFLGVLRLRNEVNVLSSVTGASKNHSSGNIFTP
ncbi:anhydro-N-acetylmuramic acid kinase [Salinimicrobium marinum]|uniref:Anhydro-N-acetylmuramic acid kinase n=1 Tax=Salinimicrobium marinum TaxID=680283 RepID=A0A918SG54_9FLAO|nr:anhydro-N-acetylmuramic acid kinase [Salinimicrobium marinum]GHA40588.1 anhydro-N-acetylmuramic acid kinase [Salinimicrobium marinum]